MRRMTNGHGTTSERSGRVTSRAMWLVAALATQPLIAGDDCSDPPDDLPDVISGTDWCLFYLEGGTTEFAQGGTTTFADALAAAQSLQDAWDRLDALGFPPPAAASALLDVWMPGSQNCDGNAFVVPPFDFPVASRPLRVTNACYGIPDQGAWIMAHELFHRVQSSYGSIPDSGELDQPWMSEGTARMMQDNLFDAWDNSLDQLASTNSFLADVHNYLASTNHDITSVPMRYRSALWWKWMSEQYGAVAVEPEVGVDAIQAVWNETQDHNGIAAVNAALATMGVGHDFDRAFQDFAFACSAKDLNGGGPFGFQDEQQALALGLPELAYGTVDFIGTGALTEGLSTTFSTEPDGEGVCFRDISRYGFRTYRSGLDPECPMITVSFDSLSGPSFYDVSTRVGDLLIQRVRKEGGDWSISFLNDGITDLVAIVGSLGNDSQVDVTFSCQVPELTIDRPVTVAPSFVGPHLDPGHFLVQVELAGASGGPVIGGLAAQDFTVEVGGLDADVQSGAFVQEQYWLLVQAPDQAANGAYDLSVSLELPGGLGPIVEDSTMDSVVYGSQQTDHVLVIDRSGSMAEDDKMTAARAAAALYIDVTRDGDGLAVVPYRGDVDPLPLDMLAVSPAVRNAAKAYLSTFGPGGSTSIGDGLWEAVDQLATSPTGHDRCSVVLLSDGMENSPLFWDDVSDTVIGTGCPVSTVAFGASSNETLLQAIAFQTGGLAYFSDVSSALGGQGEAALLWADAFEYSASRDAGRRRLMSEGGLLAPNTDQKHFAFVPADLKELVILQDWADPGFRMQMHLIDPSGNTIDESVLPYTYQDVDHAHQGWLIEKPEKGMWTIVVSHTSNSVERYRVFASADADHELLCLPSPPPDGRAWQTGQNIPLVALSSWQATSTQMQATVRAPDGTEDVIPLFDDGEHGDGRSRDGVYGNWYTKANQAAEVSSGHEDDPQPFDEGGYSVRIDAVWKDDGVTRQRQALGAFAVLEGKDADADGLPDPYEEAYGVFDPTADPDLDGLDTATEYRIGTDPTRGDTDGDGEGDESEFKDGLDPIHTMDGRIVRFEIEDPDTLDPDTSSSDVSLAYSMDRSHVRAELYRKEWPDGPWKLRSSDLPREGVFVDSAEEGKTYVYAAIAHDEKGRRTGASLTDPFTATLDNQPPSAGLVINGGARRTAHRDVRVDVVPPLEGDEAFVDIVEMRVSHFPDFRRSSWEAFRPAFDWTLRKRLRPNEVARVYARFRDAAGNETVGREVGSILYSPPASQRPNADSAGR